MGIQFHVPVIDQSSLAIAQTLAVEGKSTLADLDVSAGLSVFGQSTLDGVNASMVTVSGEVLAQHLSVTGSTHLYDLEVSDTVLIQSSLTVNGLTTLAGVLVSSLTVTGDVDLQGSSTAITQESGNNSTKLATTAFVQGVINTLASVSPSLIATLHDISEALALDTTAGGILSVMMSMQSDDAGSFDALSSSLSDEVSRATESEASLSSSLDTLTSSHISLSDSHDMLSSSLDAIKSTFTCTGLITADNLDVAGEVTFGDSLLLASHLTVGDGAMTTLGGDLKVKGRVVLDGVGGIDVNGGPLNVVGNIKSSTLLVEGVATVDRIVAEHGMTILSSLSVCDATFTGDAVFIDELSVSAGAKLIVSGEATALTRAANDNSTHIATTAFVQNTVSILANVSTGTVAVLHDISAALLADTEAGGLTNNILEKIATLTVFDTNIGNNLSIEVIRAKASEQVLSGSLATLTSSHNDLSDSVDLLSSSLVDLSTTSVTANGAITAGSFSTEGNVTANGAITAGSFSTEGNVTAGNVSVGEGSVIAGSISVGGDVTAGALVVKGIDGLGDYKFTIGNSSESGHDQMTISKGTIPLMTISDNGMVGDAGTDTIVFSAPVEMSAGLDIHSGGIFKLSVTEGVTGAQLLALLKAIPAYNSIMGIVTL